VNVALSAMIMLGVRVPLRRIAQRGITGDTLHPDGGFSLGPSQSRLFDHQARDGPRIFSRGGVSMARINAQVRCVRDTRNCVGS